MTFSNVILRSGATKDLKKVGLKSKNKRIAIKKEKIDTAIL